MNNSTSRLLASIIENSNGKIFRVTFEKKDGTIRDLVGRLGVQKDLKGGKKTTSDYQYITVYDMQKQEYRNVNKDTIISIQCQGVAAFNTQEV